MSTINHLHHSNHLSTQKQHNEKGHLVVPVTHLSSSTHLSVGRRKEVGEGTSFQVFSGTVADHLQPGMQPKQSLGTYTLNLNIRGM